MLIQMTLTEHSRPRTTLAKDDKNGSVISRSPVRSRRVTPFMCRVINRLWLDAWSTVRFELPGVGTQIGVQKFGFAGAPVRTRLKAGLSSSQ
jgi:hypothetical protein